MKNKKEIKLNLELFNLFQKLGEDHLKKHKIESFKLIHEVLTQNPAEPRLILKYIDGSEQKIDGWKSVNDKLEFLIK